MKIHRKTPRSESYSSTELHHGYCAVNFHAVIFMLSSWNVYWGLGGREMGIELICCAIKWETWARAIERLAVGERNYKEQKNLLTKFTNRELCFWNKCVVFEHKFSCVILFSLGMAQKLRKTRGQLLQKSVIVTVIYILHKRHSNDNNCLHKSFRSVRHWNRLRK